MCLLDLRGFSSKDFAKYHPGGALGKKLYLRVSDIADQNQKPQVAPDTSIPKVIVEISEKMLGVAAVIEEEKIVGIVTDGDIRRMLYKSTDFSSLTAKDIMTASPKTIAHNAMAVDALDVVNAHASGADDGNVDRPRCHRGGAQLLSLRRSSRTVSRHLPSSRAIRVRTARVR